MKTAKITNKFPVKTITKVGVLSAIACIAMLFEIPLWFAPYFYEIDLSEVVVLIGAFALGPVAGFMIELIKIVLNLIFNGTITGGIGELSNFLIGCSMIIPASIMYKRHKTFKGAIIGLSVGVISMTIIGSLLNYIVILPVYAKIMPMSAIINLGTVLNKNIVDLKTFVFYAVVPFNILKGVISAILTLVFYKKLSKVLHK